MKCVTIGDMLIELAKQLQFKLKLIEVNFGTNN